jgi:alpha-N-acetylglucosamine transferase
MGNFERFAPVRHGGRQRRLALAAFVFFFVILLSLWNSQHKLPFVADTTAVVTSPSDHTDNVTPEVTGSDSAPQIKSASSTRTGSQNRGPKVHTAPEDPVTASPVPVVASPPRTPQAAHPETAHGVRPGVAPHVPLNTVTNSSRLAIATFLDVDQIRDSVDMYYIGTRVLTYQLLHATRTRITRPNVEWLVLVSEGVEHWKIEQLRMDGARVEVLERMVPPSWAESDQERWANQFTKLLLFRFLEYDRILFMDNDMVLQSPLDEIFFQEPSIVNPSLTDLSRNPSPRPPPEYVFAARPDYAFMGFEDHEMPPPDVGADYFNGGWWAIAPSVDMFEYLMKLMPSSQFTFNMGEYMEQDLLNWAFRRCDHNPTFDRGSWDVRQCTEAQKQSPSWPMPWSSMSWRWTANFGNEDDFDNGVAALHGKWWEGDGLMQAHELWRTQRLAMEAKLGHSYGQRWGGELL